MKKPYIILTGGDGGYGNLGDEWLLDATKAHYENLTRKFHVILLKANIPGFSLGKFDYVADNLDAFLSKNVPVDEIAAVHYYGGGYLNSYWMKEKLWLYNHLTENGFSKDKFFFTGIGLGPLERTEISILKDIATSSAFFGVRDKSFMKEVGGTFMFDESVYLVQALDQNDSYKDELWINFRIASHVGADEGRIGALINQLQLFANKHNLKIKYFAMIRGKNFNEKAEMERVLRANGVNDVVIDRVKNYRALIGQFKNAAMVVTTSYHATLASLYSGVPVAAVYENDYYDYKYQGLNEVFSSPLLYPVNLGSYNDNVWEHLIGVKEINLKSTIDRLQEANSLAYAKYAEFLGVN